MRGSPASFLHLALVAIAYGVVAVADTSVLGAASVSALKTELSADDTAASSSLLLAPVDLVEHSAVGQHLDRATRERWREFVESYSFNWDEVSQEGTPSAEYLQLVGVPPCQFQLSGKYFDLNNLNRGNGPYFTGLEMDREYPYQMNLCGNIGNAVPMCNQYGGAICQFKNDGTGAYNSVVGRWSDYQNKPPIISLSNPTNPSGGVVIKFTNGDNCVQNGAQVPRTAVVTLTCKKNGLQVMNFQIVFDPSCLFQIALPSPYACPSDNPPPSPPDDSGLSGGSIFVIIFFTVFPVYLIAGYAYLYKVRGSRGMEACPNRDGWGKCWTLQKEGWKFTCMKLKGLCNGGDSSYAAL